MTRCAMLGVIVGCCSVAAADDDRSQLRFDIQRADGERLPCRIHLANEQGEPQRVIGLPFWKDHFNCIGTVSLPLPPGIYRYAIERGPEHQRLRGEVLLKPGRDTQVAAQLDRIADLAARGWYGGDLHVHRIPEEIELLMQSEDLHVAQVITWWNQRNLWADRGLPAPTVRRIDARRIVDLLAGEDERGGGALLYHRVPTPLDITQAKREYPSSAAYALQARAAFGQVWIDAEKPFWWDLPLWLGLELADSIGLANNHMQRRQMYPGEAWGKPRDTERLPEPLGNGHWSQEIYYHVLNCGFPRRPAARRACWPTRWATTGSTCRPATT